MKNRMDHPTAGVPLPSPDRWTTALTPLEVATVQFVVRVGSCTVEQIVDEVRWNPRVIHRVLAGLALKQRVVVLPNGRVRPIEPWEVRHG